MASLGTCRSITYFVFILFLQAKLEKVLLLCRWLFLFFLLGFFWLLLFLIICVTIWSFWLIDVKFQILRVKCKCWFLAKIEVGVGLKGEAQRLLLGGAFCFVLFGLWLWCLLGKTEWRVVCFEGYSAACIRVPAIIIHIWCLWFIFNSTTLST